MISQSALPGGSVYLAHESHEAADPFGWRWRALGGGVRNPRNQSGEPGGGPGLIKAELPENDRQILSSHSLDVLPARQGLPPEKELAEEPPRLIKINIENSCQLRHSIRVRFP